MTIFHNTSIAFFPDLEFEIRSLKGQLHLLQLQLQFERNRREVHAERNRRLAGKSRSNRALEEHNVALVSTVL
jgi:tuberous sclerosis protein 1